MTKPTFNNNAIKDGKAADPPGPDLSGKCLPTLALSLALLCNVTAGNEANADSKRLLSAGSPLDLGFNPEALERAVELYREQVEKDELRGVVLLVARRGQIVLHEAIGWRDKENDLPMEKDTLFRMASNTKALVTTGALILIEEGKIALEDPLAKHIPAFDKGDLAAITVAQLMSNSSGLPRSPILLRGVNGDSNLVREAERFAAVLELENPPGTQYGYSNAGFNILGGVVEAVSGQRLDDFLRERIYQPLGMRDTNHHESTADHSRMSKVYIRDKDGEWRTSWSPGDAPSYPIIRASGGMISTAHDFSIFLQTWLNGGHSGDVRLLPETAIVRARSIQSPTERYGFGWSIGSGDEFSHGGSDGTFAWVDPARELIGLIFTQSPGGENPRSEFQQLINNAIVDLAER